MSALGHKRTHAPQQIRGGYVVRFNLHVDFAGGDLKFDCFCQSAETRLVVLATPF